MSPEEIKQYKERLAKQTEKSSILIEAIVAALNSNDKETAKKLSEELMQLGGDYCEHGHTYVEDCIACDKLHIMAFPENYEQCSSCQEYVDKDAIINGQCLNCYESIE